MLRVVAGFPNIPAGGNATKTNAISTIINQNVVPTNIGIRRDTASVDYRYTPTDNWDIRANYSNMRRTGSQVDGVLFTNTNNGSRVDVAKPVADTTQNFGVNGEYSGTSAWGKKFNAMVGYNGSVYQDDFNNYTVQNPFCNGLVCAGNTTRRGAYPYRASCDDVDAAQQSDERRHRHARRGFAAQQPLHGNGSLQRDAAERCVPAVFHQQHSRCPAFGPLLVNGLPANQLSTIPQVVRTQGGVGVTSLDGSINTLLVNNVVTTQVTSDLKTKLSYRLLRLQQPDTRAASHRLDHRRCRIGPLELTRSIPR